MIIVAVVIVLIALLLLAGYLFSRMPGRSHAGPPPPVSGSDAQLRDRLAGHVDFLAGRIGQRHVWKPQALQAAADYITERLSECGLPVREQSLTVDGVTCRNIAAEVEGSGRPGDLLVVGAHYDTVPGTPGANDNASGVALLLETARAFARLRPETTVRFVAFVNEEPPFFKTARMGSLQYANALKADGARVVGMFSLETVGSYDSRPGSQSFPLPLLRLFYPDRGDFIAFVGDFASKPFLRRSLKAFRRHALLPSEGIAAPGWLAGVDWSDHWSFWQAGYPAVMVTDTALYRYADYHDSGDTPDKLDYAAMTRLANGFADMLRELSGARGVGHE